MRDHFRKSLGDEQLYVFAANMTEVLKRIIISDYLYHAKKNGVSGLWNRVEKAVPVHMALRHYWTVAPEGWDKKLLRRIRQLTGGVKKKENNKKSGKKNGNDGR